MNKEKILEVLAYTKIALKEEPLQRKALERIEEIMESCLDQQELSLLQLQLELQKPVSLQP